MDLSKVPTEDLLAALHASAFPQTNDPAANVIHDTGSGASGGVVPPGPTWENAQQRLIALSQAGKGPGDPEYDQAIKDRALGLDRLTSGFQGPLNMAGPAVKGAELMATALGHSGVLPDWALSALRGGTQSETENIAEASKNALVPTEPNAPPTAPGGAPPSAPALSYHEILSGKQPLTQQILDPQVQRNAMMAASKVLQNRGINPTDLAPNKVMDLVDGLLRSSQPGDLHDIFDTMIQHNIDPTQMGEMYKSTSSAAGRSLNINSQFWNQVRQRALQGDEAAKSMLQARSTDEIGIPWWRTLSNIQRILFTTNLSTAMRNMADALMRSGTQDISRLMNSALQATIKRGAPGVIDLQAANPAGDINRLLNPQAAMKAHQQISQLSGAFPEIPFQLGNTFVAGTLNQIKQGLGNGRFAQAVTFPLKIWSAPHTIQEAVTRNAGFAAGLERRLNAIGTSTDEMLASGQMPPGISAMIRDSIQDGLRLAWANPIPQNTVLGQSLGMVLQGFGRIPGLGVYLEPFPRMAFNYIHGVLDWNFGAIKSLVSPSDWKAVKNGDFTPITKAAVGAGLMAMGYAVQTGKLANLGIHPGAHWDQIEFGSPDANGQRKTFSILPFAMLAPGMFFGRLMSSAQNDTLQTGDLSPSYVANSIDLRLPNVSNIANNVTQFAEGLMGVRTLSDFQKLIPETAENMAAAAMTPLRQIWDFMSQHDPELLVHREQFGIPWGPVKSLAPPSVQATLPPQLSPTQSGPVTTPTVDIFGHQISGGVLHQLTGAPFQSAPSPIQAELDRLGYPKSFFSPHTGDPRMDQLVDSQLGPAMETLGTKLVNSPGYKALSNDGKAAYMDLYLHGDPEGIYTGHRWSGLIPLAVQQARQLAPNEATALLMKREISPPIQRFLEEQTNGYLSHAFKLHEALGQKELQRLGR